MTAKTSKARKNAFFKALRETGNQTLAAEAAKVSRSWVCSQRQQDAAFDAEVRAAVVEAKGRLGAHAERRPPAGWRFQEGEELVVRGTRGRRTQVARARLKQWTPRVEQRFLAMLEQSCNLRLALKTVGFSVSSLHGHRERWPGFSARCEAALALGYKRIDLGLVASAFRLFDPEVAALPETAPPAVGPMTVRQAISLVRLHERRRWEAERGVGPNGRVRGRRSTRLDPRFPGGAG
jgi:hypothetical protein